MSTQVVYKPHRPSSATSVEIPCLEARCSSKGQKFGPQSEQSRNVLELRKQWQLAVNESHVALTMLIAFAANSAYNFHFPGVYGQQTSDASGVLLLTLALQDPFWVPSLSKPAPTERSAVASVVTSHVPLPGLCKAFAVRQSLRQRMSAWAATCHASWESTPVFETFRCHGPGPLPKPHKA